MAKPMKMRVFIAVSAAIVVLVVGWFLADAFERRSTDRNRRALPLKLYWNGYVDGNESYDDESEFCIVEHIPSEDITNKYPLCGYLIEGDADEAGALATSINREEKTIDILRISGGHTSILVSGFYRPNLVRILAYKRGWVYYVCKASAGDEVRYRYARSNAIGDTQPYPDSEYFIQYGDPFQLPEDDWSTTTYIELTCSISDDGVLAYCEFSADAIYSANYRFDASDFFRIVLVSVDGSVVSIGEGKHPTWIDDNRLLYERGGTLWIYDVQMRRSVQCGNPPDEPVEVDVYKGGLYAASSGDWVSHFEHHPRGYFASWLQPIRVTNIHTGQTYLSAPVLSRDRDWIVIK